MLGQGLCMANHAIQSLLLTKGSNYSIYTFASSTFFSLVNMIYMIIYIIPEEKEDNLGFDVYK